MSRIASLRRLLASVLLLLATAAPATAQDTTGAGAIIGTVTDTKGTLLRDVGVCVAGTAQCVVSGPDGAFRLGDLRAGTYRVEVSAPGQPPLVSGAIEVRPGLASSVAVTLPTVDALEQSVVVTAPAFVAREEIKNSAYLVNASEVIASAGALQDVSRYVQTLPGVVIGTDDFRNDIIVRGGSPLENLFIVDNIEIPNINTFANFASAGGSASILDPYLIQDATFLTGGYPAPFTNRTSSVLQITEREGSRERFGARATVGFAGAGGIAEGPIARGRGAWIASVRRSFLDFFTNDVGIGGVPVLYTVNAKATYDLSPRDRLWAINVSGVDRIRLGLTEDIDLAEELSSFDIRYNGGRSATGVNWQRTFGGRGIGLLGVTHSEARVTSTVKDLIRDGIPPPDVPIDDVIAAGATVFRERSREGETAIKYDVTFETGLAGAVQTGVSVRRLSASYDAASPFGSDSPYAQSPERDAFAIDARNRSTQSAFYLQASRNLASRVDLTAGARVDDYRLLRETRVSPRAGVSVSVTDRLSLKASYGRYYQQPLALFVSVFPENQALVPWRATHYVAGAALQLDASTRITIEAFRKDYRDYPVATLYPSLSLANVGDTFNVREILFPLASAGRGRAQGVELFAERKDTGQRLYGQANLSWSSARHAGLDGVLRPGAFDYPVVANVLGGYRWTERWSSSVRFAWLSGRPYTLFDEALSTAQRRGIYDLTQVNSVRAPAYSRLDLRIDRRFVVNRQPLVVFGGVQNIANRKNFASYGWNRRLNAAQVNEQLGVFPILGLEWRF